MNPRVIDLVAGARPNFIKLAPVVRAFKACIPSADAGKFSWRIVHTGQHYDPGMNDVFFSELGIPRPYVHLGVGSGSHGAQTARIIERYEKHLLKSQPVGTMVFGDVNSTAACALAAVKLGIPVMHVEAGLRSFDRSMPEEINRMVTDILSDLLFVSEPSGIENLKREGISDTKMHLVGNVMIDTLVHELPRARLSDIQSRLDLRSGEYGLITLHRPSNVDDPGVLKRLLDLFVKLSQMVPMVFPIHPRTRKAMEGNGFHKILHANKTIKSIPPISYRDNLCLMSGARVVLTDSGGIQEETSYLGIPCLTLRENTERPITVSLGTSRLVGNDPEKVMQGFQDVLRGTWPKGNPIPLWDGKAGERIVKILVKRL